MIARLRATALGIGAILLLAGCSSVDAAVQGAFADTGAPGAIVGVSSPEGTWIAAYGSADAETNQAMTVCSRWTTRSGSIGTAYRTGTTSPC